MSLDVCDGCKEIAGSLYYEGGHWFCKLCRPSEDSQFPYFKEMGAVNPRDPKGSTAHVRDIQDRRWHPTEKRLFYYSKEKPKTYYFPKG